MSRRNVLFPGTSETSEGRKEIRAGETWRHLVAGAMAGGVSRTCTAPLDRLKIHLQVQRERNGRTSLKRAMSNMIKESGVISLWRGNEINIFKVIPEQAIRFSVYDETKWRMKHAKNKDNLNIFDRFLAGSLAGVTAQTAVFPLEVVKTRMALRKTNESRWSCIEDLCKSRTGFFRGYVPNFIGAIPYAGIDLAVYETLKQKYLSGLSSGEEPRMLILLFFGMVSSSCALAISYPFGLLKTRFQAQKTDARDNNRLISAVKDIINKEGIFGFYKGISANLVKIAPSVGIAYVVYEMTRDRLGVTMS